jgi:hypothetical protein
VTCQPQVSGQSWWQLPAMVSTLVPAAVPMDLR